MKPSVRTVYGCVLVALIAACSSNPQEIAIVGEREDVERLVGSWRGEYRADDGSRSGTIEFHLSRDSETAVGSVVMYTHEVQSTQPGRDDIARSQRLAIRFIQSGKGYVSGRLDPYEDPRCQCMIETLFDGRLKGDVIEGTYRSKGVYEPFLRTGTWKVTRTSSDPAGDAGKS